jgi:hypothetical protein
MDKRKLTAPDEHPSAGDVAVAVLRGAVGALPAGSTLVELFNLVVQSPLDKRRNAWMEVVAERLEELAHQGVDVEALKEDEEFISAVMTSTIIAVRTHKAEKLEALRNAVFNVVGPQAPDEAKQSIFFDLIDSLSVLHIQVLKFAKAPLVPGHFFMGGLMGHLQNAFPELREQDMLARYIWQDLFNRLLVNISVDGLLSSMTAQGLRETRITRLGAEFLAFIEDHSETD